jgi:phosphoenolpyruvate synthase/pyruvate phosphate dikinase
MWNQQVVSDLEIGKLDRLIAKAEVDIAANRVRDLDKIIAYAELSPELRHYFFGMS